MKNLTFVIVLLFIGNICIAQNYEPILVDSNISFYENEDKSIEGVKIISSSVVGNAKVYELSKTWNEKEWRCTKPNGPSWLGEKFVVINNQFLFFNKNGDTIFYHPNTNIGTTWRLFTFKDSSYITAKIEKKSRQLVLNVYDSVIEYSFEVKNYDGTLRDSKFNNYTLKISKNYGAIGIIYENLLSENFEFANLCGITKYKLGYNYLTKRKIFDFEIGDEFHYEEISFNGNPDDYQSKTIKKVIDKRYSLPNDTVIYKVTRVTYKDYFSNNYIDKLKRDTVLETYLIKEEDIYVKGEPILDTLSRRGSEGDDVKFFASTSKYGFYANSYCKLKENDSCWGEINDCPGEANYYMEGCGLFIFNGSLTSSIYRYEKNMVYYKKRLETWGVPINNLSVVNIEKPFISVFPNPISNTEMLNINANYEQYNLVITNLLGEEILVKENNRGNSKILLENFKIGLYFVKITNSNQFTFTQKLMVK